MQSRQVRPALWAGLVWASLSSAQPLAEMELASCVRGSPPLRAAANAARAMLDPADRQRLQDAAQARYPLYQRGGTVPKQVLMLRRGRHWQYVMLEQGGANGLCFSAVFAADRFDFTPGWIAKYAPRATEFAD